MQTAVALSKLKAAQLMTELVTIPASANLAKVVALLKERSAYEVFVVEGRKVGMVSIRSILTSKNIQSRKASSVATNVTVLRSRDSVARAAEMMTNYRSRALPVSEGGEVTGEVTAMSICQAMRTGVPLEFSIDRIMTSHPIVIAPNDPLAKAKAIMKRGAIDHLPVLSNGRITGIVTSHRLLDSIVPPEKTARTGSVPESRRINQMSVAGLMETPLICDIRKEASTVLGKLVDHNKTCVLLTFGEELQGIVTYRDFIRLLVKRRRPTMPIYMVGLPVGTREGELAETKFRRAITHLRRVLPEILEARATIRTSSPKNKKGRKRYEVTAFIHTPRRTFSYSESGWDLAQIFDSIADNLRRTITSKRTR